MRRGRIFIYLGLILILGVVAVFVVFNRLASPGPGEGPIVEITPEPQIPKVEVVWTTQAIERGQEITEELVTTYLISQEDVVEGMFTNVEDVIGQYARFDLPAGVYLTQGFVITREEILPAGGSDHAIFIPPGMVAVSIPVDRLSSVAYGVQRGDHVNVIVTLLLVDIDANFQTILPNSSSSIIAPGPAVVLTLAQEQAEGPPQLSSTLSTDELLQTLTAQVATGGAVSPIGRLELNEAIGQPFYVVPSEAQRPRLVSQTLIQDVIVLQIGNFSLEEELPAPTTEADEEEAPSPEEEAQQQETTPTQPEAPDVVTLIVTPQDAVTLNFLLLNPGARLSLALRRAGDTTLIDTEAVTLRFLTDQYRIPIPEKLPFGLEPRLDLLTPPVLLNDAVPQEEGQ